MRNTKRFLTASMAILVALTFAFQQGVVFAKESNVAKGKEVYAVSTASNSATSNVTDGDYTTQWKSGNDWNRWVEIDLKGTYEISGVNVYTPVGHSVTFNVYASNDNVNFTKVAQHKEEIAATEKGYQIDFAPVQASKVRVSLTYNSQSNLANINEVEVMGKKISDEYPKTPEITTQDFVDTEYFDRYEARKNDVNVRNDEIIKESYALVDRVLDGNYHSQFIFEVASIGVDGKDAFMVEEANGKIKISGPNGISLASGFNWYLKNVAHLNYDPLCVSNINAPEVLPMPETKVSKETPYEYKYALNFCTVSYTMAFWGWDEYEAFLDWCAMNGINLMLDVLGQEEVQRRTLKEFGYTDEEIKEYIVGPGYYAWFYMANMQSYGGPLPDSWFEQRTELARKVHDRMSIFGITPVFLGYAGQVPKGFEKKNPEAQIIDQGTWSGFTRPPMLRTYVNSGEDYFSKVADVYYEQLEKTFGDITDYYAVDPFHEGGKMDNLNLTKVASTVQAKMKEHDKDAIWVIQNWQSNPTNAFIKGLDKPNSLILDLYADNQPNHFKRNEYNGGSGEGTPWIWSMLHSFGGRMGFNGMPEILAAIPEDLSNSNYMAGIGVTAESLGTNPLLYEMIYDMGWETNSVNVQDYISDYFYSRYGVASENIEKAWDIMVDTAYFKRRDRQRAEDSIINARPGFGVTKACIYYTAEIDYDKAQFEEILDLYLKEYENLKDNEAYLYDLADITRQVLANASYEYYRAFEDAWLARDYNTFKANADKFIEIVELQDRVLSTQDEFLVGKWINDARNLVEDADDWTKDLFEFNARAQISTWGGKSAANAGGLHDYSNRQWNGITGTLYKARWQTWIDKLDDAAKNKDWARPSVSADQWFDMEYKWANQSGNEFIQVASNENLYELGNTALNTYSVTKIVEQEVESEKVNLALNKPTSTDGTIANANRVTANAVDGKESTLWVNNAYPASIEVDLQGTFSIDGIDLYFERPMEDMSNPVVFAYKIEVMDENGKWQTVVDESDNIEVKSYVVKAPYKGKAKKVKVTIPTADLELRPLVKPGCAEIYVWEAEEVELDMKNLALEGEASASKTAANPNRASSKVIDGNNDTFWAAGTGAFPQWVEVDLGKPQDLSKLMVAFEKSENDFKYDIELYDETHTLIDTIDQNEDVKKPKVNTFEVSYKGVQYVRVQINGVLAGSSAWPAVAEIAAYGKASNVLNNEGVEIHTEGKDIKNIYDGNTDTFAVINKDHSEIIIDLKNVYELDYACLLVKENPIHYEILLSEDGKEYTSIMKKEQVADSMEKDRLHGLKARFVKYVFHSDQDVKIGELLLAQKDYTSILNAYIKKYENKIAKVKVGTYSGQYLQSDYDAIMAELNQYKQLDASTLLGEDVERIKDEIFEKYTTFIAKSIVVDKNALLVAINESETLLQHYPQYEQNEAFKTLQTVSASAREMYHTFEVTQVQIDEMTMQLLEAKTNAFESITIREQYSELLKQAEALVEETTVGDTTGNVSQETMDTLVKVIEEAKKAYENAEEDVVSEIIEMLKKGIDAFCEAIIKVDVSTLKELVQTYEAMTQDYYTKDSWEQFTQMISKAKNALEENDLSQKEVDTLCKELEDAYKALETLDVKELAGILTNIDALNAYDYEAVSYDELMVLTNQYRDLLNAQNINQQEIDDAVRELIKGKEALVKMDVDKAQEVLASIEDMKENDYTEASWMNMQNALGQLKEAMYGNDRSQNAVDKAVKVLVSAVENLEKKQTEPGENENPTLPQEDNKPQDSDKNEGPDSGDTTNVGGLLVLLGLASAVAYETRKRMK